MTDTQSSPVTAEELLRDVKTFSNHGEFFRAYDLAADAPVLGISSRASSNGKLLQNSNVG